MSDERYPREGYYRIKDIEDKTLANIPVTVVHLVHTHRPELTISRSFRGDLDMIDTMTHIQKIFMQENERHIEAMKKLDDASEAIRLYTYERFIKEDLNGPS